MSKWRHGPLPQRESLGDKRKFKVVFYWKRVQPARFLRRARVVEYPIVSCYVWATDEADAIKEAGLLPSVTRVEVIDWSY